MTYNPSVSEMAVRDKRVPRSVAVTLAEETEALDGSVILPTMLPNPCANDLGERTKKESNTRSAFFIVLPFLNRSNRDNPAPGTMCLRVPLLALGRTVQDRNASVTT